MQSEDSEAVVWIGVVGVVARTGCELISPDEGAYTNFLTLARSDSEYRAKVIGALSYYQLELLGFENVRPFSESDGSSEEIMAIAAELELNRNPKHVIFAIFNTFPRKM
ncbi:MAG TPA: hypothetical protein VJ731_01285 [Terriglobales bacterium]|nr:hypothetical protein [Terriglobales bacterium]